MDVPHQHGEKNGKMENGELVSILVLMDVPHQPSFLHSSILQYSGVSILVLMDVPHQQVMTMRILIAIIGFNPCFNGCSSPTL